MSYHLSKDQVAALAVTPQEIAELPADVRLDVMLRRVEIENARRDRFWSALEAIATGGIPILVLLGILDSRRK